MERRLQKIILMAFSFVITVSVMAQETRFRGFANTQFDYDGRNKQVPTGFGIGQFDNYVTSQLSDRISFLGETVFEYDGKTARLDVERVIIKYEWSNAFNLQMGKVHNPLGFWNNAYHHGELLQPTIARPFAVKFEDEGGVMAIHTTGLWATGDHIGKLNFGYDLMVGNGIGSSPVWDNNKAKSVTSNIRIEPIEGLKLGVSNYNDFISSGSSTPFRSGDTVTSNTNQNIYNAYLVLKKSNFEIISEYYKIQNSINKVNKSHDAFFVYAGYTLNKLTPYFQYDFIHYDQSDVIYVANNKSLFTVGFRYELAPLAVFKLGYRGGTTQAGGVSNLLTAQIAWGF